MPVSGASVVNERINVAARGVSVVNEKIQVAYMSYR